MPTSNISQFLSKILPNFYDKNSILKYLNILHYIKHMRSHILSRCIFYIIAFSVFYLYFFVSLRKILNKIYLGFSNLDRNFSFSLYSCLSLDFNIKFILYTYCCLKYCTLKCIAFNKFLRNHILPFFILRSKALMRYTYIYKP